MPVTGEISGVAWQSGGERQGSPPGENNTTRHDLGHHSHAHPISGEARRQPLIVEIPAAGKQENHKLIGVLSGQGDEMLRPHLDDIEMLRRVVATQLIRQSSQRVDKTCFLLHGRARVIPAKECCHCTHLQPGTQDKYLPHTIGAIGAKSGRPPRIGHCAAPDKHPENQETD